MTEKLLPLGTIVYLKEATAKLMVVGRGASFNDGENRDLVITLALFIQMVLTQKMPYSSIVKILMKLFLKGIQMKRKNAISKFMKSGELKILMKVLIKRRPVTQKI